VDRATAPKLVLESQSKNGGWRLADIERLHQSGSAEAWSRQCQNTNPRFSTRWSAEDRRYFGTIANDDATSTGVCETLQRFAQRFSQKEKRTVDTF
jgi:hypothetical protein